MIACSPVLLCRQYSRTTRLDKRINRYVQDAFILSKKVTNVSSNETKDIHNFVQCAMFIL
ncbi:hypothetical protein C5U37_00085 [Escherichia fergusonii]|nr:hypothetical protein DKG79_02130 [Escherichia fergusonii]PQI96397.1 hypothetical protein C5U38_10865 [Escherichia fergusonii]PQJ02818.1 hypothetical protein C5U37_00085 [Escherichia fergusonii]